MNKSIQRELIIVGGGIEGRITALLAKEKGFKDIVVYDAPDSKGLGSDSLRNHAWLQSGLLYVGKHRESALKMYRSGVDMFEKVRLEIPNKRGIFRFSDDGRSEEIFYERAKSLRLDNRIEYLTEGEASQALGLFFEKGFTHYWVPDTPFDEAAVMRSAQDIAENECDVTFCESRVRLIEDSTSSVGYLIHTVTEVIEPQFTILCAGAGTIELLDQLNIQHPLAVYLSALLRIRISNVMQTPLLVEVEMAPDRPASGLSVVQHPPSSIPPKGCLVIGSRVRRLLQKNMIGSREVTIEEENALKKLVPPSLLPRQRVPDLRSTAGQKVEAIIDGKPSIDPWIGYDEWKDRYPGLLAAVPGKATLAFSVATQILNLIKPQSQSKPPAIQTPNDKKLDNTSLMHHDGFFDGRLDELKEGDEADPT